MNGDNTRTAVVPQLDEWILIVDDDQSVRETIAEMIELGGQHCVPVASVAEALEEISRHSFDLVITDMHMPGETGLDLIERFRKIDDSIPIILITGFPSINMAINAIKRGAVDFITKPFDFESITHLVAKALHERRLRQEIRRLQADVHKAEIIEKLNRELNSRVEELERLYTISESMSQFMDTETLLDHVVHLAARVTGAQRISLMMLDRGRRNLKIRASIGVPDDVKLETKISLGEAISGKVAEAAQLMRATRQIHHAFETDIASLGLGAYTSQSWLSLPVIIGGQVFGVLNLTDKPDRSDFNQQDEQIMQILLEKAAIKLENQALYEGIYANLIDTLNSLVTTIEAKDPYTHQHSRRVTQYSMAIGEVMGLSAEDLEMIEFAGVLHDIGKIGVRDEVLINSGQLTDEQYEAIKQHVLIGEKIVEPLGLTPPERAIIRNHHERFDGSGYPDGFKGEDIPFLARIVTVADAYDAMTSTRPYRHARTVEQAVSELKRNRGSQFDPVMVDAALAAIASGKFQMHSTPVPE